MLSAATLSTIIALPRAGALEHAWGQFAAGGFDREDQDPAALTVNGPGKESEVGVEEQLR